MLGSVLALSLSVFGCDAGSMTGKNTAALEGRLTEESGVSGAANDGDAAPVGLAGKGTLAAATRVRLVTLEEDGSQRFVAEGTLKANGRYEVELPGGQSGQLMIEALGAQGQVIGRALVARSPHENQRGKVQPLTSESSLEARVLIELIAQGHAGDVDVAMLRSRIDERMLVTLKGLPTSELDVQIKALAAAVWSAQLAQTEGWVRAGIDPKARFASHLDVLWQYDDALDTAEKSEADVDADFLTQLTADDLSRAGVDVELLASAEASASATSRRVIADESVKAQTAVMSAWSLSCARREAVIASASLVTALQAAGASELNMVLAAQANARLVREVGSARDVVTVNSAFDAWRVSLRGVGTLESSSMGLMGSVVISSQAVLADVVSQAFGKAMALRGQYDDAVLSAKGLFGFDLVALSKSSATVDATWRAELTTLVRTSMTTLSDSQKANVVSLLIVVEGGWR
ncbi:MAG: hypothetical protein QM817_10640 [Archangium sp.]